MFIMLLLMAASAAVAMTQIESFIEDFEEMAEEAQAEALREQSAQMDTDGLDDLLAAAPDPDPDPEVAELDAQDESPIDPAPPEISDSDLATVDIDALLNSPLDDFFNSRAAVDDETAQESVPMAQETQEEEDDEDRTALFTHLPEVKHHAAHYS
jgi:hypothetical protein